MDKKQSVAEVTFVAFDFETTGLSSGRDSIVEFGAVKFKAGKVLDSFQSLVDPGRPIPSEASKVSGITDAMVKGQPDITAVLPGFLDFIGDSVLIAHNADFDAGFLRAAIQKQGLPSLGNLIIDTVGLSRRAFPGQKAYNLQFLVSYLNIPPNQAHRALDDSLMCMKVFLAASDALSFMGDISLGEVIA